MSNDKKGRRGLLCTVYRPATGSDCSAGGVSAHCSRVTLVGPEVERAGGAVFAPTESAPAVELVPSPLPAYDPVPHAVPVVEGACGSGPMFGGCFIATSDSRFHGATGARIVALHDRWER